MSFRFISFLEKTVLKQGQWGFSLPSLAKVNFELGHQGLNLASLTRSLLFQYFFYSTDHCGTAAVSTVFLKNCKMGSYNMKKLDF